PLVRFRLSAPRRPPRPPLFPYTTLFRSRAVARAHAVGGSAPRRDGLRPRRQREPRREQPRPERRHQVPTDRGAHRARAEQGVRRDRKSTRLNSSHVSISYAVFCLKKKNT